MIRIRWDLEEIIALLWICLRRKEMSGEELHDNLKHLSAALSRRADTMGITHDEKFRNYNGMKLCYQNALYVLTNGQEGLPNVNKLIGEAYVLWKSNKERYFTI